MFSIQPQTVLPAGQLAAVLNTLRSWSNANPAALRNNKGRVTSSSPGNQPPSHIHPALKDLGLDSLPQDITVQRLSRLEEPRNVSAERTTSHVSANSFYVNKHGFSEDQLLTASYRDTSLSQLPLSSLSGPCRLRNRHLPGLSTSVLQTRGFKTRATSSGFKKTSVSRTADDRSKDTHRVALGSIYQTAQDQVRPWDDPGSSHNHQEKLKVAFAEGYSAGQDSSPRQAGADPWSKRLYRMVAVLLVSFSIYYIAFPLFVALYSKSSRLNNIFADTGYLVKADDVEERFNDVKGADEVKEELRDVVEFLGNPEKFTALGAKLPKGVLLCGPPGIGKTLLARAVAGEAGVPFIYASGSEFDEIFVGVGAKKIRDLFADAKNRAPCVIFLDEIDAVGSKRVNSETHPYANQTINQLLTEMDGFKQNEGIIILGATNRRDNLDKALMRPGRFDVEVHMQPPDFKGRIEIFELYLEKVKAGSDIDLDKLSRSTSGYTGADIANVVNQAAIRAALNETSVVSMEDLEYARDKITMGPMKKTRIPDEETNTVTAYHEAGHTLVAYFTKGATPPHKVTIMPRGQSLGHTAFIPEKDHYNLTKTQLMAEMDVAMGGRVAEEIIFGNDKITTGAGSDFQKANRIAEALVKKLGMSEKAGYRIIEDKDLLNGANTEYSAATLEIADNEIKRLLHESYERCRVILKSRSSELKKLSEALLKYETLNREEIHIILSGKKLVRKPQKPKNPSSKVVTPNSNKAIQVIIGGTQLPSEATPGNSQGNNTATRSGGPPSKNM